MMDDASDMGGGGGRDTVNALPPAPTDNGPLKDYQIRRRDMMNNRMSGLGGAANQSTWTPFTGAPSYAPPTPLAQSSPALPPNMNVLQRYKWSKLYDEAY